MKLPAATIFLALALTGLIGMWDSAEAKLVQTPGPQLTYHGGPILSASPALDVFLLWYGKFSKPERRVVLDFINSIKRTSTKAAGGNGAPTVAQWWATTTFYTDSNKKPVSPTVKLAGQINDKRMSYGNSLTGFDLDALARKAVTQFKEDPQAVYVIITADDVTVEDFCENQCATHSVVRVKDKVVPYIWVGNSATQCPGQCAWPYALPQYMDVFGKESALKAPNDVGMDGVVINLATILAGCATNPQGNGYFEGDKTVPLEAGTACTGIFGPGAYSGDPGTLLTDVNGASYNAVGVNSREFLLPSVWDPATGKCVTTLSA